ncbi:TonB-dependent receptor [Microbulbifer hydrolyticus]|uniref:Outer membrane receptor protein involved in Fe transport n=2 Tax=Microbulbifer hydrolyticus TaxID=48074 RepID=A0AA89PD17_9GAMM|nr:TonB-dependent receptor [Microbulbifer hydrolyticus]MBB5212566.1 outer membrane receptor protein involved in Fe transport [Microbulbifer hydrolyticus]
MGTGPFSKRFSAADQNLIASTMTIPTLFAVYLSSLATTTQHLPTKSGHNLEQVTVTATRDERQLNEQAEALSVVDAAALQMANAVHPSQALAAVPGTLISRGNGQESLIAIRSPVLTGAGSCGAFAIAQDGVPVRGTGFCNVNQLFDTNFEQAGRIEVLRGPGTVLYGSDAQHGVINVLSADPVDGVETTALIEGGANQYQRVKLGYSRGDNQGGFRIGFSGARDGGYKDNSGFDQQKLQLRGDGQLADWSYQSLLSLANLNQETAGYVTGLDAYKDDARKRENPNPEAFRDSRSARVQVRMEKQLSRGGSLQITPYLRHTEMDFLMHFLPGTPLEENGQRGVGIQTAYRYPLAEDLNMISGIDLEYTDAWLKQTQDGGFSVFPAGKHYDYQVNAALAAGFTQIEKTMRAATTLTLGGRIEHLRYDYDNRMIAGDTTATGEICVSGFTGAIGCRYTRPADRRDHYENFSINGSAIHTFSDRVTGTLRLAHGFRAPQASELYRLQNGQMQADLDSESVDSIEFSLRHSDERLLLGVTGFYMEKADVVFQSSDRLNLSDGESRHYGLEYDIDWTPADHWRLQLAGTIARHQYTNNVSAPGSEIIVSNGNDIDTAPRHLHTLNLTWQPREGSRASLQWQYTGSYYTDIENAHRYGGHALLHLRLQQALGPATTVGLRIENLANTDYAERADFSSLGGGDRYFIGEPRSVYADIRFRF